MPLNRPKVLLAMSGGVDSSVAAVLLTEAGYDVTGVFLCIGESAGEDRPRSCCSPQDAADARRVATSLGIDLYVLSCGRDFEPIIARFADEYARGRTPNPCILCNALIKFGRLLERADALGCQYVATGHHARIVRTEAGTQIARARDRAKDQSYALFAVPGAVLERILLPIGEITEKARVRRIARRLGLGVHDKPDSQEICFVDEDYAAAVGARRPDALRGGEIVSTSGEVLGRHDGYARYTIGQRRGLRIAAAQPLYVVGIDPETATVTVGTREDAARRFLRASGANWHPAPARGIGQVDVEATVQVRYNDRGRKARVRRLGDDRFEVEFPEGVHAITPGQAAVVYDGDRLLGGGWIDEAW